MSLQQFCNIVVDLIQTVKYPIAQIFYQSFKNSKNIDTLTSSSRFKYKCYQFPRQTFINMQGHKTTFVVIIIKKAQLLLAI